MTVEFLRINKTEARDVVPVDCGNCPVTIACALEKGGTGYTYDCCHSTGVFLEGPATNQLLMIDCGQHRFESDRSTENFGTCPLCSGDAIEYALRHVSDRVYYWVPTIYANVSVAERLKTLQARHRETVVKLEREAVRKSGA